MSFKSIFINGDEKETPNKAGSVKAKETTTKFPTATENTQSSNFGFNKTTPVQSGQVSEEFASKFFEAYEKAFEDLNQAGYDFFEFFQAIMNGDINNPQFYTMAFAMGKGMDKTITKEKLLSQSEFYINELNNLYNKNVNNGTQKKKELINQKESENQSLTSNLSSLKQQLQEIQGQIMDSEGKLSLIEGKYQPKISECDAKLSANEFAKNKIVSSIETVKQGISKNL